MEITQPVIGPLEKWPITGRCIYPIIAIVWPFGEFESEFSSECGIDTTFIIQHDFRKGRVLVNTNLDRNYIIPLDLATNEI